MHAARIIVVRHDWERYDEVLDLCYGVLYAPFGVPKESDWYHPAYGSEIAVALGEHDEVLGSARLLPAPGDLSRQVRQVAVSPHAHGQGLGRTLMGVLEDLARKEGATELWLNARQTAYGFYERLGFVPEDPEFVSELTGIPHRLMRKALA